MNGRLAMIAAHEIRRAAARTWGGKPGNYLMSIALEMAYEANRKVKEQKMSTIISINHQPSGGKEWVAEITGRHPKFNCFFILPKTFSALSISLNLPLISSFAIFFFSSINSASASTNKSLYLNSILFSLKLV
jgi:hypothetical protein